MLKPDHPAGGTKATCVLVACLELSGPAQCCPGLGGDEGVTFAWKEGMTPHTSPALHILGCVLTSTGPFHPHNKPVGHTGQRFPSLSVFGEN